MNDKYECYDCLHWDPNVDMCILPDLTFNSKCLCQKYISYSETKLFETKDDDRMVFGQTNKK